MLGTPRILAAIAAAFYAYFIAMPAVAVTREPPQDSRLDRINTDKRLKVCIWPDYYGISYRNPKSGLLDGIDVDMAKALGADLGATVEFVDSSFIRLIDDLLGGRCDVAMFAVGVTPSRQKFLRFTSPHLVSDIYAITTRSNRRIRSWADIDKSGVRVAVAKGTLHETVMREKLQQATLVLVDTPHAREQEVESGRADVFMTDYPYSLRMLANADWARLITPDSPYHLTPYAYALAPGDDRWFERLQTFVSQIKVDGRLLAAAERHRLTTILQTR